MASYPGTMARLAGIDLARALAIIGMLMVHVGPTHEDDLGGWLYALPHGRAAILFMLLAGIGVSLLAGARSGWLNGAPARLAWRSAWLLPLGLWLQTLGISALVILPVYAALFLAAIAVVRLPDRPLLGLALVLAVMGPFTALALEMHTPAIVGGRRLVLGDPAGEILLGLALEGPYPLITWAAPFLFGVWLGRRDLRRTALRWWCVLGGAGVAGAALGLAAALQAGLGEPGYLVAWDHLLLAAPHSQMPLWLWSATGTAVAVTGLCLLAADLAGRWLWPPVAMGQLALTFYVGHLLILAWRPELRGAASPEEAVPVVLVFALGGMAIATAWRWLFRRGPLEIVLALPWMLGDYFGPRPAERGRPA
ncbi:DUF418 domain-containing protein [Aquisalimonas lutea]|uniref:DUF418 domain-containing protein n=1 Tax=Aquisalimonas lutea TaxID=1327750 RepID=UPI0025B2E29F|nr:DUF418 domain-containing protein [Aquisalimonas lutea]MDN3518092.1 DUF418 domain-containing protein [Aquisalimonas lutea]